ncbi:MAG: phosphatidate cytidylyltransferase, partial [Flavobacterium sp.]|nr:phosphatidate cytidylyltransferase [Flavobacterium sp.]
SDRWIANFDMFLVLATILINIRCLMFLYNTSKKSVRPLLGYLFLVGYIIIPFILIPKIPVFGGDYNSAILIAIFIMFWTNDTFAFIIGKTIGRTKLFERISPKKTVEGFVGGLIFTMLAGILIADFYVKEDRFVWMFSAIIISIFGTLGDLVESKFKRIADVKDSGTIMPGHGGILDRLDSVIFAAPILFLLYQITTYVS